MTNKYILQAQAFLKLDEYPNLKFSYIQNNDKYGVTVKKENNDITIFYNELCTLFYGLSIVKMNIGKENFEISEKRRFKFNGSMFDCSRNQVLNIPNIKEIILVSALMGLNRFMLYTEDVYQIPGEPYFGYLRGRYSKEEIKEIVDYASNFGVDIIPCIQTLSHLNQAMRWTPYANLGDSGCTLDVEKEDIYILIEKMIKTCKENFSSPYIHIGMDEAADMGFRAFIYENRLINKKDALLKHLNKVIDICKKYDYKPMMWADMFFKLDSKCINHQWYDVKGNFDDEINSLIPDVELIYWNYYDSEPDRYTANMKTCLNSGKDVAFAGGLIRWIGMVGNISPSFLKSSVGLKAAVKSHIKSVFATTWGDAGSGSTSVTLYTILALYSAFDFHNGSINYVSKLLKAVTGLSYNDWLKLELPNKVRDELLPFENTSTAFLYQDVLLGLFDTRAKMEYEQLYKQRFQILKSMNKKNNRYGYVYKCFALMCDYLSVKTTLGVRLRKAYKSNNHEALIDSVNRIKLAIKKLDIFTASYYDMWHKEYKPFGYEINDGRLGFVRERMVTAVNVINKYLNKEIDKIPELEEEILPYNLLSDDDAHCFNSWYQIVSANNII